MSKGMVSMSDHSFKHDRDAKQCDTTNTVTFVLLCASAAVLNCVGGLRSLVSG